MLLPHHPDVSTDASYASNAHKHHTKMAPRKPWMTVHFNRKQKLWLAAFGAIYIWLLVYYHTHSASDPTSFFFQPAHTYQIQRQRYISRAQEARHILSINKQAASANQTLSVCVGIPTVKRPLTQHLNTTIATLLDGLSRTQQSQIAIHVLFAHVRPQQHPDFQHAWVPRLVDQVFTYETLNAPVSVLRRLERERRIVEKARFDYRLLLESCLRTAAPWILMLEDDVLAERYWYNQTMRVLDAASQSKTTWLYLRLFSTARFLGWNAEDWPGYLGWSVLVVMATGGLGLAARRVRCCREVLTRSFLSVVCFVCVPLSILLYFLAGRVTVSPMQPGLHVMNHGGCCSQALLFPREHVPMVAKRLEKTSKVPVDSVLENLGGSLEMDRLVVSPSLMQHVGESSYKERVVYGNDIW